MRYKYKEAQKYVTFNGGDKSLRPVTLSLPEPPRDTLIDGFGKNPIDQVWAPLKPSEKLEQAILKAENTVKEWAAGGRDRKVNEYRIQNEFWKLLEEDKEYYNEEIEFLKRVHWHLYYGYWFFNNGEPTWLPPTYFRYLQFWHIPDIPGHRPEYRDVDRRTYIWKWYARTTHDTFKTLNEDGYALLNEEGDYDVIQSANRTAFGHQKPKRRREGASNQECNDQQWTCERKYRADGVIMADKGDSARDIFEKIALPAFLKLPLWVKPINETRQGSTKIIYKAPDNEYGVNALEGAIRYIETAGEGGVDRLKLYSIVSDESAKLLMGDARRRHNISKPTLAQGLTKIHGYIAYPSTVEEMNEGGEAFRDMWDQSNFYRRNPQGQTLSGLLRIFWPAWDGLDGYIDRWGYSVIENPTEEQIKYAPVGADFINGVGAKQMLTDTVNQMLTENTPESLREYREHIRKFPTEVDHCWIGTSGDMGWDIISVDKQSAILTRGNPELDRYNLEWIDGEKFSPKGCRLVRDKLNGRFWVSDDFAGKSNQWTWTPYASVWDEKKGKFIRAKKPLYDFITVAGADPFDYGSTADARGRMGGSRRSDGGFHILLNYNDLIDGDKPQTEWETYKTIVTYRYRAKSLDEYCEDVVKAIVYWNANLSVERNKTNLWEYIIDNGYGGYLVHMQNPDGTVEKKPGIWTGQGLGSKDTGFNLVLDYIAYRITHEVHPLLLKEMKEISGYEKLKDYDLLTSFICSLIGAKYGYKGFVRRINASGAINLDGTNYAPKSIR